ncbi:unnamed protein product [Adineta ricciae]|uniref:Fibrinogen C-terminal domain-containing protein n=1 Tax=Adineta ricciae TaxID=249248 RepID=A0A814C5L2_ADIRI|nr:unnamed protein product [Adineta ricciae]CAF1280173.1 unnamed protein product [Adineta ricciae]
MFVKQFVLLVCFLLCVLESTRLADSNVKHHKKRRARFRRREFIQEEVQKTMSNYMTSMKGEITDIILDEMISYYNDQQMKLFDLENEVVKMKNSSLPVRNVNVTFNELVVQMTKQERTFALNISFMENKVKNLTNMINVLLNELQMKPAQRAKPLISVKRNLDVNELPTDCDDVLRQQSPSTSEGIFRIKPRSSTESFEVKCIFENNVTGWTVIQRRFNGTVDFYRGWNDYKTGFGDVQMEFWLGNDKIHQLTKQGEYALRIDLKPWDASILIAEYGQFRLENENEKYKLSVSNFLANISTAGDSLSSSWDNANGASFSTFDHDFDNLFYDNCAQIYHGAWWFTNCFQSHLNGLYVRTPLALQNTARNGLQWNTYALHHSMQETTMRIRRQTPLEMH